MMDSQLAVGRLGPAHGARRFSRHSVTMFTICLISMAAGFFSTSAMKWPFYGSVIVLTGFTYGSVVTRGLEVGIPRWAPMVVAAVGSYVLFAALANRYVSMAYLELLFLVGVFLVAVTCRPTVEQLLSVSNVVFSVYLLLSVLVYVEVIPLARELALFEYGDLLVLGLPFRTFVGFYGSTAAIDVYALFVAAINFLYGRGVQRWLFVILGLASSLATLRYTPPVALVLALIATAGWRNLGPGFRRRVYVGLLVVSCFASAMLVVGAIEWADYDVLDTFQVLTSGRSPIWMEMVNAFRADANSWTAVWLGTGTDEVYAVDLGFSHGNLIANPHNVYLEFLLKYGIIGWSLLLVFSIMVFSALLRAGHFFLAALLMLSGVTNLHTFGFFYPLYLLWLGWFHAMSEAERRSQQVTRTGQGRRHQWMAR